MARVKEFDEDKFLDIVMKLFWKQGYEATSMKDIVEKTGLLKGSIYGAYGSKKDLFMLALERYGKQRSKRYYVEGGALEYLKTFFEGLVADFEKPRGKKGCLVMNSCIEFGRPDSEQSKAANMWLQKTEANFKNVMQVAVDTGQVDANLDVELYSKKLLGAAFSIRELGAV